MVVTKVFQIKQSKNLRLGLDYIDDIKKTSEYTFENYNYNLNDKLDYILNSDKTNSLTNKNINDDYKIEFLINNKGEQEMVSCYGLSDVKVAYEEMMLTKLQAKKINGEAKNKKVDVLAHHIIQSFSPEDKLTPEEVHEIGRRTVLELTGGNHEFVIATHLDKEHLHNHIIFNTTNNVTLKKFQWKKGTKKSLENISDKHADIFGAKIIDKKNIYSYKKYEAYRKRNTFRYELKNRLRFLIKNSISKEDFFEKAKKLNIEIDDTEKQLKYKLMDSEQKRYVRSDTLDKKGKYTLGEILETIKENVKNNIEVSNIENILEEYKKEKIEREEQFEIRFIIEKWQIKEETNRGIYVKVDFGINSSGEVFIPHHKLEEIKQENYEVYLKRKDILYFTNSRNQTNNKFIRATTLAKQLSKESRQEVIYKNYYVSKIDKLIEEFNYLAENKITSTETFIKFQDKLKNKFTEVNNELLRLDKKIAELNKLHSALLGEESTDINKQILAEEILSKLKISRYTNRYDVEKLLKEVMLEREILNNKFNELVKEFDYTEKIQQNVAVRKNNFEFNTTKQKEEKENEKKL